MQALLLLALVAGATPALRMPPPPEGMRELSAVEQAQLLLSQDRSPAHPELPPPPEGMRELTLQERHARIEAAWPVAPVKRVEHFDPGKVADRYDIPVEMRPRVAHWIRHFQNEGRHGFRTWMERSTRFVPHMVPILEAHGVPRDTVFLAMIESGFATRAYSWAHAAGPWQFVPATGEEFGLRQDYWVDERRDPIKSTTAAARYLKQLHDQLGHWYLAWAGYNTGGTRVGRLKERRGTSDFWKLRKNLAEETQEYVPKLIAAALVAKNPRVFGFKLREFDYQAPFAFDEARLTVPVDLTFIARATGVRERDIRELNPELERWCTPPASEAAPYIVRLPPGTQRRFEAALIRAPRQERLASRVHRVRKGDTLRSIARRYKAPVQAIREMNALPHARKLPLHAVLVVPLPRGRQVPAKVAPPAPPTRISSRPTRAPAGKQSGSSSVAPLRQGRRGEVLHPGAIGRESAVESRR